MAGTLRGVATFRGRDEWRTYSSGRGPQTPSSATLSSTLCHQSAHTSVRHSGASHTTA